MIKSKYHFTAGEKIQPQGEEKPVRVAHSVKTFGVYFHTSLAMDRQVNETPSACCYRVCNICYIRHKITTYIDGTPAGSTEFYHRTTNTSCDLERLQQLCGAIIQPTSRSKNTRFHKEDEDKPFYFSFSHLLFY